MNRRTLITSAVVAGTLAACGAGQTVTPDAAPVTTDPVGFSTAAGAVVVEYTDDGGALDRPVDAFQRPPLLVVTGDGQMVMRPPPELAIQGELLADVWSQTITGDGIAALLDAARAAGLFGERDYNGQLSITDQGATRLRIVTDDGSWTHVAYGLTPPNAVRAPNEEVTDEEVTDEEVTDEAVASARQQLREFLDLLANPAAIVGNEALGPIEFYFPEEYAFVARSTAASGNVPILDWPDQASVRLADASACTRLSQLEVGELFETAAAGSHFRDDGVIYEVFARRSWPGATC